MTNNTDWIEWHGGECPVEPGTIVEFILVGGGIGCSPASFIVWDSAHPTNRVQSYRVPPQPETPNPVTSPAHYTAGEIECIDAIRAALTDEEFRGFCKGNVIKYTWRERHKGGDESLAKAVWYLERLIK